MYLERFFHSNFDLFKGVLISWASITKKQQKNEFALKKFAHTVPFLINRRHKWSFKPRQSFLVSIFSDDFELHARLVTPLNFEPITSVVI